MNRSRPKGRRDASRASTCWASHCSTVACSATVRPTTWRNRSWPWGVAMTPSSVVREHDRANGRVRLRPGDQPVDVHVVTGPEGVARRLTYRARFCRRLAAHIGGSVSSGDLIGRNVTTPGSSPPSADGSPRRRRPASCARGRRRGRGHVPVRTPTGIRRAGGPHTVGEPVAQVFGLAPVRGSAVA
jgi:hypothetical protein